MGRLPSSGDDGSHVGNADGGGMTCGNKKILRLFRLPGQRDSARDPEKACPGLDPGWDPVFGKDHAQNKNLERDDDRREIIPL
jgi:hypothetical protein